MVVLGESHVAGMCATEERRRWVNVAAELIGEFQGAPVTLHNKGISANAISPRSPGYAASAKPSALERYREDVIALRPDLFVLSYGLNDMRAGMPPEQFREDMARIITDVKAACDPVIVLTTVYHMTAYDWYPPFDVGSVAATRKAGRSTSWTVLSLLLRTRRVPGGTWSWALACRSTATLRASRNGSVQ